MMLTPVDMAHSELRSLVTKAARGAGLPWGHAEEAGWAADWLARRALPAGEWAAQWLAASVEGRPGPVEVGTALSDRLAGAELPLAGECLPDGLPAPGYLLPFLHRIAERHGAISIIDALGTVAKVDPDGRVAFGPSWSDTPRFWRMTNRHQPADPSRVRVAPSLIECLETLALRTTVPPSEASRRNAGSATTDND
jgi:hypothetical protein